MSERSFGEKRSEIEFWDDHHFRDKCEWSDNVRRLVLAGTESQYKSAFESIKALKRSGRAFPLKKWVEKDSFCPSNFPVGTILRINYDPVILEVIATVK